jgi:leucyl/phenylalanyl-tRNA---protein transferase
MTNQPTIPWIEASSLFPPTQNALKTPNGLLAASEHLDENWLRQSYSKGIFPWYSRGEPVLWWSPSPRAVLYTEQFKLSKSLHKTIRKHSKDCDRSILLNNDFEQVMRACAAPRDGTGGTWITEEIIQAYTALHRQGLAHSVEHWHNKELVGGLYCVSIGGMVFGESMFSSETDASKVAFAHFVTWLKHQNVRIIDCQQATRHLMSFGAQEVSRVTFEKELQIALVQASLNWTPCELVWTHD